MIHTHRKFVFVAILVLVVAGLSGALGVPNVHAASVVNISLYGSSTLGWGFSSGSITSPGPTINVNEGDTVNMTLISVESGIPHEFLLSYHNSSTAQPGDPESSVFTTTIMLQFVANRSGTFTYYCTFHFTIMFGVFKVAPVVPEFGQLVLVWLLGSITLLAVLLSRRRRSVE